MLTRRLSLAEEPHQKPWASKIAAVREELRMERLLTERLTSKLADRDVGKEARALYRDGWSNARIAEKLGLQVAEARKLTR